MFGAVVGLGRLRLADEHGGDGRDRARLVVLAAMAAMLVTALAVPTAWGDGGVAFALGYLVVMVLHTALFALAGENPETTRAIMRLAPTNLLAALALVGAGLTDGSAQTALWVAAIAVNYLGPYLTASPVSPCIRSTSSSATA